MSGSAMPSDPVPAAKRESLCGPLAEAEVMSVIQDGVTYPFDRQLALDLTDSDYRRICTILVRNLTTRRAQRVMGTYLAQPEGERACQAPVTQKNESYGASRCWTQYQLRVICTFQAENVRYDALHGGDIEAWNTLAQQLASTAQRMLLHNHCGHLYASEQAAEISQQACEHIFTALYPWDVSFDLWSHTIVRNVFLQRYTRSHDLMDRCVLNGDPFDLEEMQERLLPELSEATCTSSLAYSTARREQAYADASELIDAIEQMPSRQRRAVILYTYYEELSDEEIAHVIGKSRNAVQTLRHRALRQLRSLLGLE